LPALFATLLAACGGPAAEAVETATETTAATSAPSAEIKRADSTQIDGGTPQQRAALRDVLAGIDPSEIEQVQIGRPGSRWRPFGPRDAKVVFVLGREQPTLSRWKATLAAGAFRDRLFQLGLHRVIAVEIRGWSASRLGPERARDDGPSGVPAAGQGDAVALEARIREAAAAAGAEIVSLRLLAPLGVAPAVRIRVADPAGFLDGRARAFLRSFGQYWRNYDGLFVQGVDREGEIFWTFATSSRVPEQTERRRPDLVGCDPLIEPASGYELPPCPA
jgi:hypothetical protein